MRPVTEIPGLVTVAMFNAPDGLLVGIVKGGQPEEGEPPVPSAGDGAPVDWFEVLGTDAERTQSFYTGLFGWELNTGAFPGYALAAAASERAIGGGLGASAEEHWATIYANVGDVERTLARADELGGTRGYGPMAVGDRMQTGALRDPAGNTFGVYDPG